MDDKTICYCLDASEQTILNAVRAGARSLKDIQQTTKACTGHRCKELNPKGTCCSGDILEIIERETGKNTKATCSCCH
ncbi:(2Fe-2S)-binding protein [Geomonas subterranea]|uniref:(2Fe-2S)-binding protein n=1 Tax=Geomonas subterranea TaxID=2847989 RepID=UPI001CD1C4E4|nr:(2Fe-2S)-binding protein [Geomonas fuzhouensis]